MEESTLTVQRAMRRRQRVILVTGLLLVASYYVFRVVPDAIATGVAIFFALALLGCGCIAAGLAVISSSRRRVAFLLATMALGLALFGWLLPNFQRASLQRELTSMGAKVTSQTDAGDGVWFQHHGVYLPCWIKDRLGDAFFGPIDTVDFSNSRVPVDAISTLDFDESIATLNLSFSEVSNVELVQLTQVIGARQVLLNSVPLDAETLRAFGQMKSLKRIAAIDTNVSSEDAIKFAIQNPTINLIHGDSRSGYGFVRVPIAQP